MTTPVISLADRGFDIAKIHERDQFFNFLIYGESGVGKTILAGSADAVAAMRPVLFIDIEGGSESLRVTYPDVEVVRIKTWKEMQRLYNILVDTDHGYQTVVVDSLSEAQKFNMMNIMSNLVASNPATVEEVPSTREWGINLEQMRKFVRAFRDLEINTIFTCHAARAKDERTGRILYGPSLSGKLAGEISGFLSEVFYMYIKEITEENGETKQQRMLLTGKTETTIAKDRSQKLSQVVVDPSMEKLYKLMTAKDNA